VRAMKNQFKQKINAILVHVGFNISYKINV